MKSSLTDRPARKPRSKTQMIAFLRGHFRYSTMNSWNGSTSYAQRIKVHRLNLSSADRDACFDALEIPDAYCESGFNAVLRKFDRDHQYRYQIGTNGRSGGYLVLYRGESSPSGYKSYCDICGQKNYTSTKDTGTRCGRCGAENREDYPPGQEPRTISVMPGQSLGDESESAYEDWDLGSLRSEMNLVWEFDAACEEACRCFVRYARRHQPVETTILVPTKVIVSQKRTKA